MAEGVVGPAQVPGARRPDVRRLRAAVRALDLVALGDDAPADEYDDVADRALSVLARTGDPGTAVGAVRRYLARVWGVGLDDTGADRLHALLRDVAGTRLVQDAGRAGGAGFAARHPDLDRALDALAGAVGDDHHGPWDDEHDRHALYAAALRQGRGAAVRSCLADEPDPHVATSVVLTALDDAPDGELDDWARAALADARGLVAERVAELRSARALAAGLPIGPGAAATWSDPLQRRLAGTSDRPDVLEVLGRDGRTRRVRGLAQHRLAQVRRGCGAGEGGRRVDAATGREA
ncbi:hypothetical protein AB6N23_07490 [Cellulomonas sp. 179-A 9B4 NHS]|uniref:hypothetical protein n=1 Tax=Cellulomonas sp. 179-A 9B4 NHS TaxID=3142379 RepID=UPI00399EF45C